MSRTPCDISFFFTQQFYFPASGQAVVTGVVPSPPRFLPSISIAHRVQQSHCSSILHQVLLTHALALSASQFVHKQKSLRICTSMHSAGLELTKLTCCCCSHINSHNQVRDHRTGSSHSGAEEYPREKHKQTKGGTRIDHS